MGLDVFVVGDIYRASREWISKIDARYILSGLVHKVSPDDTFRFRGQNLGKLEFKRPSDGALLIMSRRDAFRVFTEKVDEGGQYTRAQREMSR